MLTPEVRKRFFRVIVTIIAWLTVLLLMPYLRHTVYVFHHTAPFRGEYWHNPYQDLTDTLIKANFHAHNRVWGGLTWGVNSARDVTSAYTARGYLLPLLSNYHSIAPPGVFPSEAIYIPAYEHGVNFTKVHCLCIGASRVRMPEFPWHISLYMTQYMIDRLNQNCRMIALAHPGRRNNLQPEDVALLSGYHLIELNYTHAMETGYWDAALSAGRPVWIIGTDDTHDLDHWHTFMKWTMIYAAGTDSAAVYDALTAGSHYAVVSYDGQCEDNQLRSVVIRNDTLTIALRDKFNRLDLYGQNGRLLHQVSGDSMVAYVVSTSDTYVRAEVHHDHCVMYLNPVVRVEGISPKWNSAEAPPQDSLKTWAWRGMVLILIVAGLWMWRKLMRRPVAMPGSGDRQTAASIVNQKDNGS